MGEGPIPATKKVLARAGLRVPNVDVVELNEAFAAQSLACIRGLDLEPDPRQPARRRHRARSPHRRVRRAHRRDADGCDEGRSQGAGGLASRCASAWARASPRCSSAREPFRDSVIPWPSVMEAVLTPREDDSSDVRWALETALAMWGRAEREQALRWLVNAVQSANTEGARERAEAIGRAAAELERRPAPVKRTSRPPPFHVAPGSTTQPRSTRSRGRAPRRSAKNPRQAQDGAVQDRAGRSDEPVRAGLGALDCAARCPARACPRGRGHLRHAGARAAACTATPADGAETDSMPR